MNEHEARHYKRLKQIAFAIGVPFESLFLGVPAEDEATAELLVLWPQIVSPEARAQALTCIREIAARERASLGRL